MLSRIFILLFLINTTVLHAQTPTIDNLKKQVSRTTNSRERLSLILLLCENKHSLPIDTLLRYALEAKAIAAQNKDTRNLALAESSLSAFLIKNGQLDSALNLINTALNRLAVPKDHYVESRLLSAKAQVYIRTNRYKDAIATFYEMLHNSENVNDTLGQIMAKNGIGWANMEMDQNEEAIKWFHEALDVSSNEQFRINYSSVLSNMAACFNTIGQNDSAEYYIGEAVYYSRKGSNLSYLANALNIQADIFIDNKRFKEAEQSLNEALAIRKQVGDPFYIVSDMSQLGIFYANSKQAEKGVSISQEAIKIAEKYGLTTKLPLLYQTLAENYKAAGELDQYGATLEKVISLKDSVFKINSAEAIAEMQAKYSAQKQENIIIQQELALQKKNVVLWGSVLVVIFAVIIALLLFKNYRRKQKHLQLTIREEEKRKAKDAVVEAEENERKRIAADLHDNMGAYATAIIANVDDVSDKEVIRPGILQSLKTNASEIMSSLRETIWALNKDRITLTGISDRFKTFVKKMNASYTHVQVEIKEEIENDIQLSPVNALNIFRILQEAVTNALKHSNATLVKVYFGSHEEMKITVSDNGTGFITKLNGYKGNGMVNMQARAMESGLQMDVLNGADGGTVIRLLSKPLIQN